MIELENGSRYLKQWAVDQRVQIDNFLPGTFVDFSLRDDGREGALTTEAYEEDGHVFADIPNILLQICGWLHVSVSPSVKDAEHRPEEKLIKIVYEEKPEHYIYSETPLINYKALADRIKKMENEIDGQIADAVNLYLEKNPVTVSSFATVSTVDLNAESWEGGGSLWSQVVSIEGVTEYSQVDLTPDVEQLAVFYEKDLTFVTENDGGIVTVYAIGQKPENDYTIQVTITEVNV